MLQHSIRLDRPVQAYDRWMARIPEIYGGEVIGKPVPHGFGVGEDPNCLGLLKNYRSLMPMAQEARKPIFHLRTADGALGAHVRAVEAARKDFEKLAIAICDR